MNLVLDAGALIGIDRRDREVLAHIEIGRRAGASLVTSTPVVGRAWRDGARQARLARSLSMIDAIPVALVDAQRAGELLGTSGTADVVDALLVGIALPGDRVLTSDPTDIRILAEARGVDVVVVVV